jgi:uncharacterized MAPEG superfamily protein
MALNAALAPYAWSLLLAAGVVVFSTVPLGAARSQADFQMADLAAPRAMFDRLPAWGKRAAWAHQNCFEAFTLVAAPLHPVAMAAAWIHPALRLAYIGAYVANVPPLRGLCWAGGLTCSGILYVEGLRAVLAS